MFERFTDRARRVIVLSADEARRLNHDYIGTEHILLGLVHEGEGIAAKALESLEVSLEDVRSQVEEIIGRGEKPPGPHIPFTPRAKKILELSLREALELGHEAIGTEHILLGLLREGEGIAAQILAKQGLNLATVRQQVLSIVTGEQSASVHEFKRGAGGPAWNPEEEGVPACPSCGQALTDHLRYTVLHAAGEEGDRILEVVYCDRCGAAIGYSGT